MSSYDNDPRVQGDPDHGTSWRVTAPGVQGANYTVVEAEDGMHYAYTDDGRRLTSITGGDFDTVVRALIGNPW